MYESGAWKKNTEDLTLVAEINLGGRKSSNISLVQPTVHPDLRVNYVFVHSKVGDDKHVLDLVDVSE